MSPLNHYTSPPLTKAYKIKQLGQQASLLQNGDTDFDNPRGCVMSPAYTVQVTQSWLCMLIDSFLKYTVFITL